MTHITMRLAWPAAGICLVLALAESGCGNRYGTINEDTPVLTACIDHNDCGVSEVCDEGVCVSACTSSGDCQQGEECVAPGVCQVAEGPAVTVCTTNDDCPISTHCQIATGQCVDCLNDDHCAVGLVCQQDYTCGTGVVGCTSDAECSGLRCDVASQQCVQCLDNGDCPPGQTCHNRACSSDGVLSCSSPADCAPDGKICDLAAGECRDCASDAECGTGQLCSAGTCVSNGCTTLADCNGQACYFGVCTACFADFMCMDFSDLFAEPKICDMNTGHCVDAECSTAYDCLAGEGCSNGYCGQCNDASECRDGEACTAGVCGEPPPPPDCYFNDDCSGGLVCVSGACVSCTASYQCDSGLDCVEGICKSTGGGTSGIGASCVDPSDCRDDLICLGDGTTGFCSRTCIGSGKGSGADCPSGFTCQNFETGVMDGLSMCNSAEVLGSGYPGYPFSIAPGDSCAGGNTCQSSICMDATQTCVRSCIADRDCDSGEVCWAVWDEMGNMVGLHMCYFSDLSSFKAGGDVCSTGEECDSGLCTGACNDGVVCNRDADCQGGTCAGTCADHCRSNADCTAGQSCNPWPAHIDAMGHSGWMMACLPKYFDGTAADGASCASHAECSSDWCVGGRCTTPCAISLDCTNALSDLSCQPVSFADEAGNVVFSLAFCM